MRNLWWFFLMFASPALAQNSAVTGFCTAGATQALLSGIKSNNTLQGVVPRCTVTVYNDGTLTPATIYSTAGGTQLDNPFTANANGQWLFYASTANSYDVQLSGGVPPNVFPSPIKLVGLGGGTGGSVTCGANQGPVNILCYGVAGLGGDDTAVWNLAVAAATSATRPLYVPTGTYGLNSTRLAIDTGLRGDGQNFTVFQPRGTWAANSSIIQICGLTSGECPNISFSGFSVACGGSFPPTRSANPADVGNTFTGILIGAYSNTPTGTDFGAGGCLHGAESDNLGGTVRLSKFTLSSNWYNFYYKSDSGDLSMTDGSLAGALFASLVAPGQGPPYSGGFNGLHMQNVHTGFAPYAIYQENGTGNLGIYGAVFDTVPMESVGNECIRMPNVQGGGDIRSTLKVVFINPSCAFTTNTMYIIEGDSSNPVQDYAWNHIDMIQGGGEPDGNVTFIGGDFAAGTTGFSTKVNTISGPASTIITQSPQLFQVGSGGQYIMSIIVPSTGAAGQAKCVKAVGPPQIEGVCSTVVSSSGGCTCN